MAVTSPLHVKCSDYQFALSFSLLHPQNNRSNGSDSDGASCAGRGAASTWAKARILQPAREVGTENKARGRCCDVSYVAQVLKCSSWLSFFCVCVCVTVTSHKISATKKRRCFVAVSLDLIWDFDSSTLLPPPSAPTTPAVFIRSCSLVLIPTDSAGRDNPFGEC